MSEKKVVSRTLAIVLVIVCGVLAFCLVGTFVNYTSIISTKDNTIATMDSQIASLNAQISDLNDTVKLNKQTTLDNNQLVDLASNTYTTLLYYTPYAGYIKVDFTASVVVYFWAESSLTNIYYSRYPPNSPDNATSGSFITPVLPGVTLLSVYNPTETTGASMYITVTYVY